MDDITKKLKSRREVTPIKTSRSDYSGDVRNLGMLLNRDYKLTPGKKDKSGKVRAILAFDTTGSMGAYRQRIRQDLSYMVSGMTEMLDGFELAIMGCGDHCDGPKYLQMNPYSSNPNILMKQISSISDTGGGDVPEAFECLFHELNYSFDTLGSSMILITDSVPHGMKGYRDNEHGCPLGRDYATELAMLKKKLKGFYIISCVSKGDSIGPYEGTSILTKLQRTMVDHDKYIMGYDIKGNLATLVMGMCMSDIGRLGYMMKNVDSK